MIAITDTTVVTTPHTFEHLTPEQVVVLDGEQGALSPEQEEALCTFVERGGGLVCLGNAIEAYHEYPLLGEVLGNVHGTCTPRTEIIACVANADHYITRRVDSSFAVLEAVYLLDNVPSYYDMLWRTSWHYTLHSLAYARPYSRGRVFCTTLGSTTQTQQHPVFQQMLARAIRYASGVDTTECAVHIAMFGYGAIGFEHGTAISNVPGLEYTVVCYHNESRLALARQAFPGIRTCTDLEQVAADPDVDLVIVSTPPSTHASISVQIGCE